MFKPHKLENSKYVVKRVVFSEFEPVGTPGLLWIHDDPISRVTIYLIYEDNQWFNLLDYSNGGGASVEVIDNLDSDSSESALSARQGNVLKTALDSKADISAIERIDSAITNINNRVLSKYTIPTNGIPWTDLSQQVRSAIESGGSSITVIDNLYSESSTNALSARQGNILDTKLDSKQDKITDLATIRANALNGSAAYQAINSGIDKSLLKEDVQESLRKANSALQTHQTLKTINGESIVGTGNIVISGGGGGDSTEIVDSLTSESTSAALSARQGFVLKSITDNLNNNKQAKLNTSQLNAANSGITESKVSVLNKFISGDAYVIKRMTQAEYNALSTEEQNNLLAIIKG